MIETINNNRVLFYFTFLLIITGCSKQLTFDELIKNEPIGVKLKIYKNSDMKYNISLLEQLKLVDSEYSEIADLEVFIDTTLDFYNEKSILTIYKYKSNTESLVEEWSNLSSKRISYEKSKIYSEGMINYLNEPAYFEHLTFVMNNVDNELINFLFKGSLTSFYLISLEVNKSERYPDNLKELLLCAKSIKTW